jgi:NAD(P)-dependent dehydrogenase (short-subunit alcohol dehydrogenase family)
LPCTADISDRESLRELVERTCAQWHAIDILVLNAVFPVVGTFDQMDEKAFAAGLTVNLVNNAGLVKDALPLLKAKGGSIIFISSIFGEVPVPEALLYGIVKGGFNYMAAAARAAIGALQDPRERHRAGADPNPSSTPILDMPEIINPVMENVPLSRPGEPDEIAALAVLLASPGGAFITGQTINDDGGWSLGGKSAREMIQNIGKLAQRGAPGGAH